jgi:hypothetical protein
LISHEGLSRGSEGLPDVVLTCGRTFARGYRLQQPSAQRHRGLTADGLAIRADGSSQVSGIGKIGPWPRSADNGRGCVKTKTDLAVNQFCKIQTLKSRRFESRLGFLARFAQFAKVPRVLTQPRPAVASHLHATDTARMALSYPF